MAWPPYACGARGNRACSLFLRDVAAELAGRELGDGIVLRTCRDVLRGYWHAPDLDGAEQPRARSSRGKYR
jgi:hypothetical protein